MKKELSQSFKEVSSLMGVKNELLVLFDKTKKEKNNTRIGYVAGIITSDGLEHMQRNIERLARNTEEIRQTVNFPLFSATEIFGNGVYNKISEFHVKEPERGELFINFWREILSSGYITDIYLTPRWDESKGARDEFETAKQQGLEIHYVK